MKIINLYCEGKRGSHDFDILEKVIDGLPINITIKPIGGKQGAKAIMEYQEKAGTSRADFYLLFRDRDFDIPIPATESLVSDNKKTYYSYRTTIENYLLNTDTFFSFLQEEKNNNYSIGSKEEAKALFIKIAESLKNYQAVRHTLGKLRFANSFGTTWLTGSGTLPEELNLETCKTAAWQLIATALKNSEEKWTKEVFESTLQEFLALFNESFFEEQKFLIYYQGKDFAKALTKELPNFSIEKYYKFAKKHFDYTEFTDLVELRKIIKQAVNH